MVLSFSCGPSCISLSLLYNKTVTTADNWEGLGGPRGGSVSDSSFGLLRQGEALDRLNCGIWHGPSAQKHYFSLAHHYLQVSSPFSARASRESARKQQNWECSLGPTGLIVSTSILLSPFASVPWSPFIPYGVSHFWKIFESPECNRFPYDQVH